MKVVLFEICQKQASLRYRSGEELTTQELELLKAYVQELISQKTAMEPRT